MHFPADISPPPLAAMPEPPKLRVNLIAGLDAKLMNAAIRGDIAAIKEALALGANPMTGHGWPLKTATERSDLEAMRILLPLTDVSANGHGALLDAAMLGHLPSVEMLIPTANAPALAEALSLAAAHGKEPCLDALLAAGADPTAERSYSLEWALRNSQENIARKLLPVSDPAAWGLPGGRTKEAQEPWHPLRAVAREASLPCVKIALNASAPPLDILLGMAAEFAGSDRRERPVRMAILERVAGLEAASIEASTGPAISDSASQPRI
jgi:hypothetical protein